MAATATATRPKPRLKNLDDLFQINDGINPLEQIEPIKVSHNRTVVNIAIKQLVAFHGHPFRLYEGERLDDMVESIRKNGILVPIIVRHTEIGSEILSGHNRVNAARLAGLDVVPAIVLGNITDTEAWIYVVETNLMQRSFSDMSHSEKAAVIAVQHSKLFSQGKRNDILSELKILENPHGINENGTCAQVGHKLKSTEVVAKEYSLARNTVARYLRINQLIPELKTCLDNGDFAFIPAVTLSFLKEEEQSILHECLAMEHYAIDMKKAYLLREHSEKGTFNTERVRMILSGDIRRKAPNRTLAVKIKPTVYARYFKPDQSVKEVQQIIEKALALFFEKQ